MTPQEVNAILEQVPKWTTSEPPHKGSLWLETELGEYCYGLCPDSPDAECGTTEDFSSLEQALLACPSEVMMIIVRVLFKDEEEGVHVIR